MLSNQNLRENQPSSSDSSSLQRDDSPAECNSSLIKLNPVDRPVNTQKDT